MTDREPPSKRRLAYRIAKGGVAIAAGAVVMAMWTPVFALIYLDMLRGRRKEPED